MLWLTQKDKVNAEIATMLGVETADSSTEKWFDMRMKAVGSVLKKMSEEELAELDARRAAIAQHGYSDEQKRK